MRMWEIRFTQGQVLETQGLELSTLDLQAHPSGPSYVDSVTKDTSRPPAEKVALVANYTFCIYFLCRSYLVHCELSGQIILIKLVSK